MVFMLIFAFCLMYFSLAGLVFIFILILNYKSKEKCHENNR